MARRAGVISATILMLTAVVAFAATPGTAQAEVPCAVASLQEGRLDWQSATSPSRALKLPYEAVVLIAGPDPSAPIEVSVEALGTSWTIFEGRPSAGGAVAIDVSDHARYGVGLYDLRVSGGCSASVWVEVTGRSPLTKPAGILASLFALVGLALVVWSIVRGNAWRGAFGGLVLGLGVAILLQQFAVLPLTVIPLMVVGGGAAVAGGAGGAVAQRVGGRVGGAEAEGPPVPGTPPRGRSRWWRGSRRSAPEPDLAPTGPTADEQGVLLGASSPRRVQVGREVTLRFLAYREDLAAEVEHRVAERSPTAHTLLGLASCRWQVGTPVVVTVSAKGLDIGRPRGAFEWNGSLHILEFDATAPEGSTTGTVVVKYDVAVDGIVVARLRHDLDVTSADGAAAGARAAHGEEVSVLGVQPARTAFASYASEDRSRVLDRVAAIRSYAKIDVWLDTLSLHPGDRWEEAIAEEIRVRDVFLLFWSARAAASRWVEWEWRAALRDKDEGALQLQPLEPVAAAPPPPELSHLHFGDVVVDLRSALQATDHGEEPGAELP